MYDPISGNAAYAKYSPVALPPIEQRAGFAEVSVKLNPHTSQPELITYLNKVYRVRLVTGCMFNKDLRATEYGVKIGNHRTKVWKTPEGVWYIHPNR